MINKRSKKLIDRNKKLREFYEEIWNSRPQRSEVSGQPLYDHDKPACFSHLLSKGSEPKAIFDVDNVVLMTPEEHRRWEDGKREGMEVFIERMQDLKLKYNQLYKI